jgi:hypothetical protein
MFVPCLSQERDVPGRPSSTFLDPLRLAGWRDSFAVRMGRNGRSGDGVQRGMGEYRKEGRNEIRGSE